MPAKINLRFTDVSRDKNAKDPRCRVDKYGMSIQEISDMLGLDRQLVYLNLKSGLRKIRDMAPELKGYM